MALGGGGSGSNRVRKPEGATALGLGPASLGELPQHGIGRDRWVNYTTLGCLKQKSQEILETLHRLVSNTLTP